MGSLYILNTADSFLISGALSCYKPVDVERKAGNLLQRSLTRNKIILI